jgi:hypothetical protein
MPDDVVKPSELEQLISEAERGAQTPVTDHPKPCEHPADEKVTKCPTCLWSFCPDCASPLDPKYCRLCLPLADGALTQEPLIDADGVTHTGRVMHPDPNARFFQPRFGTLAKTISEMQDPELEDYIHYYKDLVQQAERALDFRRVVLGSAQLEQAQRGDAKRRQLRADKTKFPVKTLTVDKNGGQKKKTASTADLIRMMEMLKQLQANREAKTKAQKEVLPNGEVKTQN